jgi:hypothetical protein
MRAPSVLTIALVASLVLSGCTGKSDSDGDELDPGVVVPVDDDTGGVRGVVVDAALRPVAEAKVEVIGTDETVVTAEDGVFAIGGLLPGPTAIRVTHPLYAPAQVATIVVAGVADPEFIRVTLERTIPEDPYLFQMVFDGYLVCSAGTPVGHSEECGEGVGVDCIVPVVGCQRVGGQDDNAAQFDFYVDGPKPRTILVEQVWEATSPEGESFYTVLATNWTCTPICEGNRLGQARTGSPLTIRYDIENNTAGSETITPDLVFSTFTWGEEGVALNQKFRIILSIAYVLPLPEGWSFVNGDEDPF